MSEKDFVVGHRKLSPSQLLIGEQFSQIHKLKDKRQAWTADAKAIKEGLGASKKMIVSAPADAKAKLDALKVMIDRWENTFKEMASSAPKSKAGKKKK